MQVSRRELETVRQVKADLQGILSRAQRLQEVHDEHIWDCHLQRNAISPHVRNLLT